jgi:hypothetical protein
MKQASRRIESGVGMLLAVVAGAVVAVGVVVGQGRSFYLSRKICGVLTAMNFLFLHFAIL